MKNATFGLKKKQDWNYTFFHVSGHSAEFEETDPENLDEDEIAIAKMTTYLKHN